MKSKITLLPSQLEGGVTIPPSKSLAHRYLIGAALSEGQSFIENIAKSVDIVSTINALQGMGGVFSEEPINDNISNYIVKGVRRPLVSGNGIFDCAESGSTLRFLIPLLLLTGEETTVIGRGKLVERPLDVYYELFGLKEIDYQNNQGLLPLNFKGNLSGGVYPIRGNVSSQFITGLLYALSLVPEDSKIILTTPLESKHYVDLTLAVLKDYGIEINVAADYSSFKIKGGQKYKSGTHRVEGDYSQVAFYAVAAMIGKKSITCYGLKEDSLQGDKAILSIIEAMGGSLEQQQEAIVFYPSKTKGITIDVTECPDLVPALTLLGILSEGITHIIGAERLTIKESNRLESSASELNKLSGEITVESEGLLIKGVSNLGGNVVVESWNDHRIAMTLAMATQRIEHPITLKGWKSVEKSYPNFWEDYKMLGGTVDE